MRTADGGDLPDVGDAGSSAYTFLGSVRTFRVNPDQSTTPVVNVTAQSTVFGVQFTWTVLAETWDASGPAGVIPQKTGEVNLICGKPHVQDFRTEQDQGPSQVLYNFAVITVGTDDQSITDEVRVRMDHISPPPNAQIDAVWQRLADAGAV
jgi:hypothetical protein